MKIKRVSDKVIRSFRMRICHVSDTHGGFPRLHGRYDAVLHTGDFFPNSHHVVNRNKVQEAVFQMKWLEQNVDSLKQQLQGHPYLFVLGNHDFVNPQMVEMFLNAEGVKAFDLTDKIVTHEGVNFYGFPYVPEIGGDIWNYELDQFKMHDKVEELTAKLNLTYTDVLACHAPFYQCLDLSYGNQVLGNHHMANALTYKVSKDMTPSNYLCGHIHEANGVTYKNNMLVSNAATTYHIVEV